MNIIKILTRNTINFLALMFLLMVTPPTFFILKPYFWPQPTENTGGSANMPALKNYEWAKQSVAETYLIRLRYRDFVVHRASDFSGEAITVENGVRRTVGTSLEGAGTSVWFFGGSTTWGYGVHDAFTYPSMFAQQTGRAVINYGEGAYSSRQSLAYLQNVYLERHFEEPTGNRTIVFYDGINDVMHGCNPVTTTINQTGHEARFQNTLRSLDTPYTYKRLFAQLNEFASFVAERIGVVTPSIVEFKCSSDPERVQSVADNLIAIWSNAQRLAEANGDTFIAVFQPVSFVSKGNDPVLPNHPYSKELLEEFSATYPLIRAALAKSDVNYVDLSNIYDNCPVCYYDHSHVGPEAHQRLVDNLIRIVP
jgi:hypothetical protein